MKGGRPATVLLVEDNRDTRDALAQLLTVRDYFVAEACDGQEAWDYLSTGGHADVIVLDLEMPRVDGRLFRAMQLCDPDMARIPVIVFSVAVAETLPDVIGTVRKTRPEGLLDLVAYACRPGDPGH